MKTHEKNEKPESAIYLCAPVNALVEGIFEENIHLAEVLKHGDFGLGTFDDLDGEMLILDGHCYQIRADGRVIEVGKEVLTPFASVTFYTPGSHYEINEETQYKEFLKWLNRLLPSPNLFYAIRIEGEFVHIKARSVPKQANYHPLSDIAHEQVVFDFDNIRGTLAGFFTPDFMSSLSVPGLHLHFLSEDLQHGGHVFECVPRKVRAGIQLIHKLELSLPMTQDYMRLDFHRDIKQDLDKVEK
jgi:acetolactate decarboxylase